MAGRKLTVVQLLPALDGGSVERGILEVAQELARRGHDSWVVSGGGQLVSRLTGQGSRHLQWPIGEKSLWTLRWVRRLRAFLQEQQVDILHAHARMPAWVAWRAWKGMPAGRRPRLLTTVHELYPVDRYSAVVTRGERVVAVSRTAQRHILEHYPKVDPANIEVIPKGVDHEVFPYGYRPADSWYQRWFDAYPFLLERFVLALPAGYACPGGYSDFLDLVAMLVRDGVPVHGLVVAGESDWFEHMRSRLQQELLHKGLDQHVTLLQRRLDVREIYAASNAVLYLSRVPRAQNQGILEVMAMGVPTLGYAHGIAEEHMARVFPEGLVDQGDLDALHGKIMDMYQKRPEVPRVGLPGAEASLDSIISLYHELVQS